jgi:type VI secretion system protein ImpF
MPSRPGGRSRRVNGHSILRTGMVVKEAPEDLWLRPSLLDRLVDHQPEHRRERVDAQQVDDTQLRQLVRRDLTWLFNTTHFEASVDLSEFPEVSRSILNYGIPDLIGRAVSGVSGNALKQQLRSALSSFESRLIPSTIDVQVTRATTSAGKLALFIEISGSLRTEPMPTAIRMRAEVDLESGRVGVGNDLAEGKEA